MKFQDLQSQASNHFASEKHKILQEKLRQNISSTSCVEVFWVKSDPLDFLELNQT